MTSSPYIYIGVLIGILLLAVIIRVAWSRREMFTNPPTVPTESTASGTGHKMVMFSVDWCPHCKSAAPEFASLGSSMTVGEKTVAFEAVNPETQENPYPQVKIEGYPTVVLMDPSGNVKEYAGAREKGAFLQFLESNVQ